MDKALKIDCIRKRYEHELMLEDKHRANHIDVEIKRVMGEQPGGNGHEAGGESRPTPSAWDWPPEGSGRGIGSYRQGVTGAQAGTTAGSNPTSHTTETAPLNGGITQQDEASALSGCYQTSRNGLGDSCERSLVGDASTRKDEHCTQEGSQTDCVKGVTSPTTIITEPVAAENNKQRER